MGDITFKQCISEMSKAGYQGTETGHKYPKNQIKILETLRNYNLEISSSWMSTFFTEKGLYKKTLERFMKHLSFIKSIGGDVINLCECGGEIKKSKVPLFSKYKPIFDKKKWILLINGLHEIGRIANDHGMKISYHFHLGTGVQNENEIDYLMEH